MSGSVFPVQKSTTEHNRSSFGWGPIIFGRARSLVRFPPRIRFAPPHITAQSCFSVICYCILGRFQWWGDACVSRYHGPSKRLSERRGGPWAPPPLVLLILLFGRVSLVDVGKLGVVFWFFSAHFGESNLYLVCVALQILALVSSGCLPLLFLPPFPPWPWEAGGHRHNDFFRTTSSDGGEEKDLYDLCFSASVLIFFQVLGSTKSLR